MRSLIFTGWHFLLLLGGLCVLRAEKPYELLMIDVPGASPSWAVDLNEHGSVAGTAMIEGRQRAFLWREDSVEVFSKAGEQSIAHGLNNRDEVVGSVHVQEGLRPWLHSNRTNYLLGRVPEPEEWNNAARAINDEGVVVGNLGGVGYVLHPATNAFPQFGGGPCWSGWSELVDIDNSGAVLGHTEGIYAKWPLYTTPSQYDLIRDSSNDVLPITATRMHGSKIVGSFWSAPALIEGGEMRQLSAPGGIGTVLDINDAGLMVGEAEPGIAMVWNGSLGTELASLVEMPAGGVLVSACGINEAGEIAGTISVGGSRKAVLLRPRNGRPQIPIVDVVTPEKVLYTNQPVEVQVQFGATNFAGRVVYTIYERELVRGSNLPPCDWEPIREELVEVLTTTADAPPFAVVLPDIAAGQYAYQARMEEESGAVTYSHMGYFAVAGFSHLQIQKSWMDDIEVALVQSAGRVDVIEVSTNLVDWVELGTTGLRGDLHVEEALEWKNIPQRYYRAKTKVLDPDAFEVRPQLTPPLYVPTDVAGVQLEMHYESMAGVGVLKFKSPNEGEWWLEGGMANDLVPFTYQWGSRDRTLRIQANEWSSVFHLEPKQVGEEQSWRYGDFREEFTENGYTRILRGTYAVRSVSQ